MTAYERDLDAAADRRSPPVIDALTGIRALAALWVLLCHMRTLLGDLFPAFEPARRFATAGFLGLEVFFVLSGFIISHNYARRLARDAGLRGFREFMAARIARIYPVHLLTTALALALAVWTARSTHTELDEVFGLRGLVVNLLALQGIGPQAWNVPAWSVTLELVFYLAFPFVAWRLVHSGPRACALLGAALLVVVAGSPMAFGLEFAQHPVGLWVRLGGEFAAGALAWRVWQSWTRPHVGWDGVALVCAAGVTAISAVYESAMNFLAVPLLVIGLVATANATGPVRALLASRPVEWGGRISYSFYLTHVLVLFMIWRFYPPTMFVGASLPLRGLYVLGHLVVTVAVAALTYHLVEERSRSWLRSLLSGRPSESNARRDAAPAAGEPTPAGGIPAS